MEDLKMLWNENKEPITMEKLAAKKSRFVAAGIFFELMGKLLVGKSVFMGIPAQ